MSELSASAQQKVLALTKGYINSFPEKVNHLETCWHNIEASSFDNPSLDELRNACHKLAGSSGSYQLLDISDSAKTVEQMSTLSQWEQANALNRGAELKACFLKLIKLLQNQG